MNVRVPVVKCPTCEVPYVLRFSLFMVNGREPEYLFARDCKHKTPPLTGTYAAEDVETALLSGALAETERAS